MWDAFKYSKAKLSYDNDIRSENKSPYSCMQDYKLAIVNEDYETAKAITEVLATRGHKTIETHKEIACLQ